MLNFKSPNLAFDRKVQNRQRQLQTKLQKKRTQGTSRQNMSGPWINNNESLLCMMSPTVLAGPPAQIDLPFVDILEKCTVWRSHADLYGIIFACIYALPAYGSKPSTCGEHTWSELSPLDAYLHASWSTQSWYTADVCCCCYILLLWWSSYSPQVAANADGKWWQSSTSWLAANKQYQVAVRAGRLQPSTYVCMPG